MIREMKTKMPNMTKIKVVAVPKESIMADVEAMTVDDVATIY